MSKAQPQFRGVFIDRDGTLIKLVDHLNKVEQVDLEKSARQAVHKLNKAGWKVIVVTNQSAIARGLLALDGLERIHQRIVELLGGTSKARIDGFYFCPHHPDEHCDCRKPKPALLLQAARDHNIELSRSIMIGDHRSDILAGVNAGCETVLVLTGYGKEEAADLDNWPVQPNFIALTLDDAANWILKR